MKLRRNLFLTSLIALSMPHVALAGTTWDGSGGDTNINTQNNWDDNNNPTLTGGGSTLTFGTGGSTATINSDVNVAGIVLNRDANFEIANGATGSLTIGSSGIGMSLPNTTGRTHTISENSLILGASQSWTVTNNGTGAAQLNVSSVIDDGISTFGITKAGNGTLILSGDNSFGGNLTLGSLGASAGILRLAHNKAAGNGTISILNGNSDTGVLELTGGVNIANNVSFYGRSSSATGAIFRSASGNNTLSGVLTGGINGGNHNFEASVGATLTISNKITTSQSGRQLNFRGGGNFDITGVIEETGAGVYSVRLQQGSYVILSGDNSYEGLTNTDGSGNVLNIRHANALGSTAGSTTVTSGNALQIQNNIITTAEALSLAGTGISDSGALRNISGNNTYSGAITLNAATRINSDLNKLTLDVASGNAITSTNLDVTFGGAGDIEVKDAIALGTGKLTKDGAGTLTLSANSTYTGDTLVNNGTLALSSTGGLKFVIGADDMNNKITGTGAGTLTLDGLFTFDLTTASTTLNDSWNIVDVANLTESFGSTFSVDTFTKEGGGTGAGIWTKAIGLTTYSYQFNTASGVLSVIPEPSAALLGGLGLLALLRRRR
ncbi:MAG: hypothetical protein RLZZ505_2411 [Verrucomicrobiota bacterium]|jgi:autotransporter-associated beta strand protein